MAFITGFGFEMAMTILASIATFLALLITAFVFFANEWKTSSDKFVGRDLIGISWMVVAVLWLIASWPAHAHDHNKPELTPWFESLRSRGGAPCCDGTDATRLDEVDWDMKDGHYRVRLNGQWVDVPDDAVIEGPNRAGPAMVWPYTAIGVPVGIRCFMPSSMS